MSTEPIEGKRITVYEDPGGEWSALYVDGKLVRHGDHHNVVEELVELTGVDWRYSSLFIGKDGRTVASTVEEVERQIRCRDDDMRQAEEYDAHAKSPQEKAAELRRGWKR